MRSDFKKDSESVAKLAVTRFVFSDPLVNLFLRDVARRGQRPTGGVQSRRQKQQQFLAVPAAGGRRQPFRSQRACSSPRGYRFLRPAQDSNLPSAPNRRLLALRDPGGPIGVVPGLPVEFLDCHLVLRVEGEAWFVERRVLPLRVREQTGSWFTELAGGQNSERQSPWRARYEAGGRVRAGRRADGVFPARRGWRASGGARVCWRGWRGDRRFTRSRRSEIAGQTDPRQEASRAGREWPGIARRRAPQLRSSRWVGRGQCGGLPRSAHCPFWAVAARSARPARSLPVLAAASYENSTLPFFLPPCRLVCNGACGSGRSSCLAGSGCARLAPFPRALRLGGRMGQLL